MLSAVVEGKTDVDAAFGLGDAQDVGASGGNGFHARSASRARYRSAYCRAERRYETSAFRALRCVRVQAARSCQSAVVRSSASPRPASVTGEKLDAGGDAGGQGRGIGVDHRVDQATHATLISGAP